MATPPKFEYYALRIDPENEKNCGDFAIRISTADPARRDFMRALPPEQRYTLYHYASEDYGGPHGASLRGEVVNPKTLEHIRHNDPRHHGCVQAVKQLGKHIWI